MAEGMSGLVPTFDVSGNNGNCNGGWGNWGGALIGGAIGGAIGGSWRNNNGCCNNGGCGCNGNNGNGNALAGLYLMDSLSSLRTDTASIGRDAMLQTFGLQNSNCQGFAGLNASVERVGAQLAQAQSRTEAAVLTASLQGQLGSKDATIQGMRDTYDLKSSIDSCCCTTQRSIDALARTVSDCCCETRAAIHGEGEATRALISKYAYENLQEKLCDAKAKIGSLEAQQFASGLAAGYAQQGRNDLNNAVSSIIGHMAAFRTTPASGGGAAT